MAQAVVHRALDGSTVEIRSSLSDSVLPLEADGTSSFVHFDIGSPRGGVGRRQFLAGSPGLQSRFAEMAEVTLTERYTLPSGRLRAGSTVHVDSTTGVAAPFHFAVWEDRVSAFVYGGRQSDLVELFGRFAFHHTPEGPWMQALPGKGAVLVRDESQAPCLTKPIRTLGLLDLHALTPDFTKPPAASVRTQSTSGDTVYVEHGGTGDMRVLMVGKSAVSRLLPHEGVEEATALSGAASLEITWAPRA